MKQFSRFEIAIIKRTAQNVKGMRVKKAKIEAKIVKLQEELSPLEASIDLWETPIKAMTGGYTSEEVLASLEAPVENTEDIITEESVEEVIPTETTQTEVNPFEV